MLREDFILSAATATPVFGTAQINMGVSEFATTKRRVTDPSRPVRAGAAGSRKGDALDGAAVIM